MGVDIFDLKSIAEELDLRNRRPDVDTTIWWARLNTGLPPPTYRQYSMDRGGPGVTGGGTAVADPDERYQVCSVPKCDSILTVEDFGGMCRQCKLEGLDK